MAAGNFRKCLSIILHHEGGFVNHPRLDMINKLLYQVAWLTKLNSPAVLNSPFTRKAHPFIKNTQGKNQDHILAKLKAALTMPMRVDYATRIILGSVTEKIYQLPLGIGAEEIHAESATSQLTERGVGHSVKVITKKSAEKLCDQFALMRLVAVVQNVVRHFHITFMTSIIQVIIKKILLSARQLKSRVSKLLRLRSQSAFFYARIATG